MAFPNVKEKHKFDPFFSPKDFLKYAKQRKLIPSGFLPPRGVILCYANTLPKHLLRVYCVEKIDLVGSDFYLIKNGHDMVGVCTKFGVGAPAATTILENLLGLGIKRFLSIGSAGSLQTALNIGDITVCDHAIRDEGVSHHYIKPSKFSFPSDGLTKTLSSYMAQGGLAYQIGPSWTIDAPYRETVNELRKYRSEGILTVEMETAALFAVAEYRQADLASALVVSDVLGDVWEPRFESKIIADRLNRLFDVAVKVLSS